GFKNVQLSTARGF
uniref:Allatotropin n=3 Tax=Rhodnius prolixus TaxID=13249 RepID=ALLT_RHOPR|nr:RecName: Full=Allatotropin; Short=Rhopr-AT; Contains: RecName: Full=Allatotropin(2-13); Short=RRhopr-AT(2-13); Contains: RecName: Full=Allatotropin(4-13); Short=RRhopr-AT(4-13) [Rhodnius prolixus]